MSAAALPRPTWTTGTTEAIKTGTWRAALPVHGNPPSPCRVACPVDGAIVDWIAMARAGDLFGAWTTLTENNPFPAVAGRVCHRPCESACNRAGYDEPLAVRALERHVGEVALAEGWRFPAAPMGRQRVAVVGGGPSGLSAAYQLRRRGCAVTIFEAQRELGGLLRDGIPPYRLPRAVLDGEIRRILALGIEVRAGTALASAEQFLRMRVEFDAIYLALGARRQKRLPQLDYRERWVMDSAAYLAAANAGAPPPLGRRIAVIGGGSAAMDAARSARRAGHEVSVLALESEAHLPAQREEVVQAIEAGIALYGATVLKRVAVNHALTLHCAKAQLNAGNPLDFTPIPGSDFTLDADAIVPAIGQDPDLAPLQPLLDVDGALLRIDAHHATRLSGVFAGGDVASSARFVTQAIGMGRDAAIEIDQWLMGEAIVRAAPQPPVSAGAINTFYHPRAPRAEDADGLSAEQALAESERCFSCGRCTFCDNCFRYCPDMAVRRVAGGYAIAAEYCKGCGLCVRECPTGSLALREEWR
jgi:NADPH-dependent glutamate synthase beta subunit-like oxidoreductase/Pyruvate/2-oxoacid:ferredoxin oxidoreductase delta subunit